MNRSTLHKLLLARRLLELARGNLTATNDISLGVGINQLQDSVELFLLAVSEHLNAGVKERTAFDQYFELINQKIAPKELPFRVRLLALNKLRVNSKHHGLAPAKSEVEGLPTTVREFFDETTTQVFNRRFATISLLDLVKNTEAKELLNKTLEGFFKR